MLEDDLICMLSEKDMALLKELEINSEKGKFTCEGDKLYKKYGNLLSLEVISFKEIKPDGFIKPVYKIILADLGKSVLKRAEEKNKDESHYKELSERSVKAEEEAVEKAQEANTIAEKAVQKAQEANKISEKANKHSWVSNIISGFAILVSVAAIITTVALHFNPRPQPNRQSQTVIEQFI